MVEVRRSTWPDCVRIAARAQLDPKTVQAFLEGRSVRAHTAERVRSVLRELGIDASHIAPPVEVAR